ncbi:Bug family tripartite tricarboxylate transporter substrate binding protein [Xanthobacter pseudotagetidis]|uniref:Bug family tripartite tricarboxylate transporter substrate binding protein n=1 Tax=Xanthobacter pseudotagetidis TaxID=3119911 RepID=UPI00372A2A3B
MLFKRCGNVLTRLAGVLALGAACVGAGPVRADYPDRTISIVVPFSAGGSTDQIGRMIADHFQKEFKVPVVVENKPGANAAIGNTYVARSKPDGYTLLIGGTDIVANQFLYKDLPFDPEKDFTPIGIVAEFPFLMLIDKKRGIETVAQYVEYAKKNPDKLNFSSAGTGNSTHLAGETFKHAADLKTAVHIPYNGSSQSVLAVISGQVDFTFDPAISSIGMVTGSKANALAVVSERRLPSLPNVPTMSELGYKQFDQLAPWSWKGLFAPSGTPKPVLDKLQASLARLLLDPVFQEKIERTASLVVPPRSTDATEEFLRNQRKGWKEIIAKYASDTN